MPVDIRVDLHRETDRAIMVAYNSENTWIPKSQILAGFSVGHTFQPGDEITLRLTDWIARQKNITSNTTPDDSPINEDKFTVGACGPTVHGLSHQVLVDGLFVCSCADERTAKMIAAAMALTDGKI